MYASIIYICTCTMYVHVYMVWYKHMTAHKMSSLHVQPCGVVEVHGLVGSGPPPLYSDTHGLVQTQGAVAVLHCSLGFPHSQVTLSTITGRRRHNTQASYYVFNIQLHIYTHVHSCFTMLQIMHNIICTCTYTSMYYLCIN